MAKRYEQMIDLVPKVKPKIIVEIGVHKALRAYKLCKEALRYQASVHYIGCDIFGLGDEQFQQDALNGKGPPSESQARARLSSIKSRFTFDLIVGDTTKTLAGTKLPCDFAFIDGDHRVDAIRSDYEAVKEAKCVVFDDYYVEDQGIPDLTKYGANQLVDELAKTMKVQILPIGDRCKHGGMSKLAVVWK